MERSEEGDELLVTRVITGHLHCGFDRFRSRVAEVDTFLVSAWGKGGKLLGEVDDTFVIEVGTGHVKELAACSCTALTTSGCASTRRGYRDTSSAIYEAVSVNIFDDGFIAARHDERIWPRIRRGEDRAVARYDVLRFRAR